MLDAFQSLSSDVLRVQSRQLVELAEAKYGALLDLIACVDTVNGGLGDDAAGDREAAYQRCKRQRLGRLRCDPAVGF